MRGKQVFAGGAFWPNESTTVGEEFAGVYQGLHEYDFKGDTKKAAHFETEDGMLQISGGMMVKMLAPHLKEGEKYVVVYGGKKDTGKGQAAHQFEVYEHEALLPQ